MDEEELQENIRTLELYRAQMENFDKQYEFLVMTLKEHNSAKETMEGYKDIPSDSETLIPIGAGSYMFAKVKDPDKAIVGIGADIVVETTMDDAISKINERIVEIEEAMKSLGERYTEISRTAQELTAKVQSAYVKQ
jgi:prefoldin alpha subunit